VIVVNVLLVNMPLLEPKIHAQLALLALGPLREQLNAQLVPLELPLLLVQFLLTPVLVATAKMLDVSHALKLVKVSAQNVAVVMLWLLANVPNVMPVNMPLLIPRMPVILVLLALGLLREQLNAQLALMASPQLKAQLLLKPVLPALVKMLDVSHALSLVMVLAQNVLPVML